MMSARCTHYTCILSCTYRLHWRGSERWNMCLHCITINCTLFRGGPTCYVYNKFVRKMKQLKLPASMQVGICLLRQSGMDDYTQIYHKFPTKLHSNVHKFHRFGSIHIRKYKPPILFCIHNFVLFDIFVFRCCIFPATVPTIHPKLQVRHKITKRPTKTRQTKVHLGLKTKWPLTSTIRLCQSAAVVVFFPFVRLHIWILLLHKQHNNHNSTSPRHSPSVFFSWCVVLPSNTRWESIGCVGW